MANSSNASLTLLTDSCCEEREGGRGREGLRDKEREREGGMKREREMEGGREGGTKREETGRKGGRETKV